MTKRDNKQEFNAQKTEFEAPLDRIHAYGRSWNL